MQISAETKDEYKVLIWTTALKSGAEDNVEALKSIYEAYTVDNKKISCDQEISGKHFKETDDLANTYDLIYIFLMRVS